MILKLELLGVSFCIYIHIYIFLIMNLSNRGSQKREAKLSTGSKVTTLNPNATEFIPSALRSPSVGGISTTDATARFSASGTFGKTVLDRSQSSVSNNSDEEAHRYWHHQLPDDITPDFKEVEEDDSQALQKLSLAGVSLHDIEASRSVTSTGGGYLLNDQQDLLRNHFYGNQFSEKSRFYAFPGEDLSSPSSLHVSTNPWEKQILERNQLVRNGQEGPAFDGNSRQAILINMLGEQAVNDSDISPLEFLALQFPGIPAESLSEVYFANGGDLKLTIEMLSQLEFHVDGGFNRNLNSKTFSTPNLSSMDFSALTLSDGQNGHRKYAGDDVQESANPYHSPDNGGMLFKSNSSISSRGAIDLASALRKFPSHNSGMWKYDKYFSANTSIGSGGSSHVLASSYSRGYNDRLQNDVSPRAAPIWLETGDGIANMYTEQREEAHDRARLRNSYFEQARQAYLIGNRALAKDLSARGQLHDLNMKAAHGKAQELIFRQRNLQGSGRARERMIDLHGLHVSEAIHVLKQELSVLRSTASAAEQRLQVYIFVGTGQHMRGSRAPAKLPFSVQRYLLEEEGLDYTEPQPGLLRVVIC